MSKNKSLSHLLPSLLSALLLALLALALLVSAVIPFGSLRALADSLMPDGEFESLTPANALVFRGMLLFAALFLLALAGLTWFHRWGTVMTFHRNLAADGHVFLRSLTPGRRDAFPLLTLLLISVAALVFRLEYIYSALHHDEAYTYMAFAHSLRVAVTDYHLPNNHVFHSILVFLSTQLAGNTPLVVRLPALAAGILLVPAVYALGKRHYDAWVGLGAALLVAASPALIGYSVNARGYTLVALLGVVLLLLGVRVLRDGNRFAWVLIVLVSALGMYTLPAFLFPFGVLFIWLLLEMRAMPEDANPGRLQTLRSWLVSGSSAALLTLLLYLPILVYSGASALFDNPFVAPVPWQDFPETLLQRLYETGLEWTFRVPVWVTLVCLGGWVLALVFHRQLSSTRVMLQAAAALWIAVLLIAQRPNAWSKIWVFLLPLALLWASAGIIGVLGRVKIRSLPLQALTVWVLLLVLLWRSVVILPQLPELWRVRADEESAVLFAAQAVEAGDALVVSPPDDAPVWYYAELHGVADRFYRAGSDPARLWVFVNPGEGQSPASVLDERGPGSQAFPSCAWMQTFGKLQVHLCQEVP